MNLTMKYPNFLIIGVQKAGTTSIYNYLGQHPQVYMSPIKETNFLEKDWEKVGKEQSLYNSNGIDTWEKYCQLFAGAKDEIALGEASPNYLFHYKSSVERILKYVPEAKLIAILRNPIERAYSDYLMHIRDEIGEQLSLKAEIELRPRSSFLLKKGFYSTQLQYYFEHFDKSQIKIYLYDDLKANSVKLMQDLYKFIGVDNSFYPDMSEKVQTAQIPKSRLVNKLLRKQNPVRSFVAKNLKLFLPEAQRQKLRSQLIKLNSDGKEKAKLSQEERKLLQDLYQEEIVSLQELIGRDLSSWLRT